MKEVCIVGLDLAKRVFQVHAARSDGSVILRRKLSRGQVVTFFMELPKCIVAVDACATARYWAREIGNLAMHARIGTDYGNGSRSFRAHHGDLQKGMRFYRLARLGAKTAFERREAGARPNVEYGTTRYPSASYHRRDDRHSMGMPESSPRELVAGTNAGAQTSHVRRDRPRQQNGSIHLGNDDQERRLQAFRSACSVGKC